MDNELDEVARSLFNGQLPPSWRKLAPATLKLLGSWMEHFLHRHEQYTKWVCGNFVSRQTSNLLVLSSSTDLQISAIEDAERCWLHAYVFGNKESLKCICWNF